MMDDPLFELVVLTTAVLATVCVSLFPKPAAGAEDFRPLREEAQRATDAIRCPAPKITAASAYTGALYGCIMGPEQTAKFWINEETRKPGVVRNVKVMWNDWFQDIGYGVHADRQEAISMVNTLADLYVPELKTEFLKAFAGNQGKRWTSDPYAIECRYSRGSAIEERLLILKRRG